MLEIGFGTGLNSFLALNEALKKTMPEQEAHQYSPSCPRNGPRPEVLRTNPIHTLHIHGYEQNRKASLAFQGHHQYFEHFNANDILEQLKTTDQLECASEHR